MNELLQILRRKRKKKKKPRKTLFFKLNDITRKRKKFASLFRTEKSENASIYTQVLSS